MAGQKVEFADFAAVDSRSSPLRMPPGRALRCRNWRPMPNGILQLRHGFTVPTMSSVDTTSAIHSGAYYETNAGSQRVIYSQATTLKKYEVGSTGTVSTIGTLSDSNPWNGVFADNKFIFGNGTDEKIYDDTTLRNLGIRPPSSAETASITVSYTTATAGSWTTSTFSGHQLFMSYYNPNTGHFGNRVQIGARFTTTTSAGSVIVTGLPSLAAVDTEWVKVLGRTHDNGQVPYLFVDGSGTLITVGNTASTATFTLPSVDANLEMPTRNTVPPNFKYAAWCLGRMYVIDEDDPTAVRFSESKYDVPSGLFVGVPYHAWPSSNKTYFPAGGGRCRGIHTVDDKVWVWTDTHVGVLTEFGAAYSAVGKPVVRWLGTFVGGLAGHRAFAMTPFGPYWVSKDKQLMKKGENGPTPASLEYEAALLAQIADAQVANIELAYHLDPAKEINALYIHGIDSDGNPVEIVHDFAAGNVGREHVYSGVTVKTFIRNPQTVISMRDSNGKTRLWAGSSAGRFAQLEDGDSDNDATYSADIIQVFNSGPKMPLLTGLEWFGDGNARIKITNDLRLSVTDLDGLPEIQPTQEDDKTSLWRAPIEESAQYNYVRMQMDSHHSDGTLARSSLPGCPLETYGRIYMTRPEMGAGRDVGASRA